VQAIASTLGVAEGVGSVLMDKAAIGSGLIAGLGLGTKHAGLMAAAKAAAALHKDIHDTLTGELPAPAPAGRWLPRFGCLLALLLPGRALAGNLVP